jgi:hypothetical protein
MVLPFSIIHIAMSFVMLKRLTILSSVIALGLVLGGCTRCGWIWNDWQAPASCKDDAPRSPA